MSDIAVVILVIVAFAFGFIIYSVLGANKKDRRKKPR